MSRHPVGAIFWTDLTVKDADSIRDFYSAVVGWKPTPHDMGDYADYDMTAPGSDKPTTGICHARGMNADIPPQWMIYISVANLDHSMAQCQALGGRVLVGPKPLGDTQRYCVIQDPAGAVATLMET